MLDRKDKIAEKIYLIGNEVSNLQNSPGLKQVDKIIKKLYSVMRSLSEWEEENKHDS